jgi:hypothetical protein
MPSNVEVEQYAMRFSAKAGTVDISVNAIAESKTEAKVPREINILRRRFTQDSLRFSQS